MQSEVQVFNFEQNEVQTVVINDEVWFVGKDIANILGYSNSRKTLADHVDEEDKQIIQRSQNVTLEIPNRGLTLINQSGVISLALSSKLPSARKFKRWVTSEVIPSVLKHGSYQVKQLSPTEMLKLQNDSILEVSEKVDRVEDKVDTYIENQAVNATDYGAISTAVTHRVHQYAAIHHIEKENRGPLFKDLNSQIKQVTGAGNRSRIKSKDYDMVIRFIDTWEPSTATKAIIEQMSLDLDETA
ncbi:BRO family protein [Leuconostoc pseudomesenteroides]|uniref:BRO family protein n=1 Tax=Leuconostoc pseudomesenteroides TaxID=33968 RepID=UPI0016695556|nr:BRO family protein [Leuconostoc pseudomesenteroides]